MKAPVQRTVAGDRQQDFVVSNCRPRTENTTSPRVEEILARLGWEPGWVTMFDRDGMFYHSCGKDNTGAKILGTIESRGIYDRWKSHLLFIIPSHIVSDCLKDVVTFATHTTNQRSSSEYIA